MKCTTASLLALVCGLSAALPRQSRRLGTASPHPFFATSNEKFHFCAGALISSDVVVTAAHCQGRFKKGVRIGPANVNHASSGELRKVVGKIIHRDYDPKTGENDIMLLKLDRAVDIIDPVPFERSDEAPEVSNSLTMMGYGAINNDGKGYSPFLSTETVYTEWEQNCKDRCGGSFNSDAFFCTTEATMQCFYENSGAPIIDDEGVLVGIKAWGGDCFGMKNIYNRVGVFGDWIEEGLCAIGSDNPDWVFCGTVEGESCDEFAIPLDPEEYKFGCGDLKPEGDPLCGLIDVSLACPVKCDTCEGLEALNRKKCVEDGTGLVTMGDIFGKKDCDWLNGLLNLTHHIRFVCERTEVALFCSKTCDTCDKLDTPTEV